MQLYEVQARLKDKGSRLHPSSPLLRRDKSDFGAARKAEGRVKGFASRGGPRKRRSASRGGPRVKGRKAPVGATPLYGASPHAVGEPSRLVQQILRKLSRLP